MHSEIWRSIMTSPPTPSSVVKLRCIQPLYLLSLKGRVRIEKEEEGPVGFRQARLHKP